MGHTKRYRHAKRRTLVVAKTSNYKLVDRVTYICAIIEPLLTLPQVYAIYSQKDATGVSILSWVGFWLFGFIWLWYGIAHKDKVIITYEALYIIIEAVVVAGAVMYGGHL